MPEDLCPSCPYGVCIEDHRVIRVRGRATDFRLKQNTAIACTFSDFVPGTDNDPAPERTFDEYIDRFRLNARAAGLLLFGETAQISGSALAKVEGDVFQTLEAAALWNATAVWNQYMMTGTWTSRVFTTPLGAVSTPTRRVAVITLPRGYDATRLFKQEVRAAIAAHEESLKLRGMELGLSVPDIIGVRVPDPMPEAYAPFLQPLPNLSNERRVVLETCFEALEGTVDSRGFLFALAVKRTVRSDRLYQPLFEANVLKYLIQEVLKGAAFRFHVHIGSFEGAAVEERYKAASLASLMRGGQPTKAIDELRLALRPQEDAQVILNTLPLFPL